jgi:hypothetical protein
LITITGGSFIKPNQQCNERTALRTERGQSICKDALTPFCFLSAAERQKREKAEKRKSRKEKKQKREKQKRKRDKQKRREKQKRKEEISLKELKCKREKRSKKYGWIQK